LENSRLSHYPDFQGGVEKYHSATRKVVLTSFFAPDKAETVYYPAFEAGSKEMYFLTLGEGWFKGDLNPYEASYQNIFISALFLYEEVWLPYDAIKILFTDLGEAISFELLESSRVKLYSIPHLGGFTFVGKQKKGKLFSLSPTEGLIERQIRSNFSKYNKSTIDRLMRFIEIKNDLNIEKIVKISNKHIKIPSLRKLLGLNNFFESSDDESLWNALILNRVYSVTLMQTLAGVIRADAVQFEGGLSRIASEIHYSTYEIDRNLNSISLFDAALRKLGTPDLGQLLQIFSFVELVKISNTDEAQGFRDWFWSNANEAIENGESLDREFLEMVKNISKNANFHVIKFKNFLYRQKIDKFIIDPATSEYNFDFTTNTLNPDEVIKIQRRSWSKLRMQLIQATGFSMNPYAKCPCKSGEKFKFCCGITY
jgi:hypothetical protein